MLYCLSRPLRFTTMHCPRDDAMNLSRDVSNFLMTHKKFTNPILSYPEETVLTVITLAFTCFVSSLHVYIRPVTVSVNSTWNSKFLGAFAQLRKPTISLVMSVRLSAWNNSAPTGRIFMKLIFQDFSQTVEKIRVSLEPHKNTVGAALYVQQTDIYIYILFWSCEK